MPITAQNILAHEWIGLQVTVKTSPDPGLSGLVGTVKDETRNTMLIEARNHLVTVPKLKTQFIATLPTGEAILVEGPLLRHRPEDRVKKGSAKW
ncbi:MAG TPA: ribonuclease P protein subunit [Candidatus Angelobacter sp.]|nr:ribonuclease P protein subunit [Candidatus Angelobacter sp.]